MDKGRALSKKQTGLKECLNLLHFGDLSDFIP